MSAGEQIKRLLSQSKLTQSAFASRIGISRARLNNYVTGRSEPDCATLCRIADAFQTSVDTLLERNCCMPGNRAESFLPSLRMGAEKPADDGSACWMPLYSAYAVSSADRPCSGQPIGWIRDTRREASFDVVSQKMYALRAEDDALEPYICRGDIVFVQPRIFLCPYNPTMLEDSIFAVRLHRPDQQGLLLARCTVSDGRLICYGKSPDQPLAVLNMRTLLHAPLAGKATGLWRTLHNSAASGTLRKPCGEEA